jgi:MFS family permease
MPPTSTAVLAESQNRQHSLYYGWPNVAVAALAMVGTLPGRTQGLGLITEPLITDLGLDRVTYAGINLWATLIGASFCLPCGRLVDRFGSRRVLSLVALSLGSVVLWMSYVNGLIALAIAVTLTRGFGQSALSVVSLSLVGKWFSRRLDFAMGIYSLLVGIGFIIAFPSVGQATLAYGWRNAWFGVGLALIGLVVPLALVIVRNGPEEIGLRLDGVVPERTDDQPDLTFNDALRSPAFWIFALGSSLFGLVYSGIALFNESILEQRGFDAGTYHTSLVISTLVGLCANFGGGWLASRWSIQKVMGCGMAVLALSLLMLPFVRTFTHVAAYATAMGVAGGVVTVVFFSVWGQVFGRTHLGRIQGCAQMITVFASALGPLLLAQALQRTGSYSSIFFLLSAVVLVIGIASWGVRLPVRGTEA